MWHFGSFGVFQVKALPAPGDLVLRYNQRMGAKHLDPWTGTIAVLETVGKSIVTCLNLETKMTVYIHLNYLRSYQRPDTREWKMNPLEIKRVCS